MAHLKMISQKTLKVALASVTRLGDLLDFGPLFKAFGNIEFA